MEEALDFVAEKRHEATERIMESWPTRLDISSAKGPGCHLNVPLDQTQKDYLENYESQ